MKLHLLSKNQEVHRLCQEVMADLVGQGWTLHIAAGPTLEWEADLYIWDFEPGNVTKIAIPESERWRHFFLIDRSDIGAVRDSNAFTDAQLLLKPLSKAAVTVFFAEACERATHSPVRDGGVALEHFRDDRDEIFQCLIETNLKLQEYDQDRTNFLARAIHDFRAPLTAITGYCGLLIGDDLGPLTEEQHEVLERIQRSAKRLSRMATAMFQLSVAPRAAQAVDLQKGDIRECVDQALNEIMPLAEEKGISVTVDVGDSPEPLFFERPKLEQLIINLFDNACKFTPRCGSIEIKGYPFFWDRGG